LSTLGKDGLRKVASLNYHKAHYAADRINALDGYQVDLSTPFFNEFVVRCPAPVRNINAFLLQGGYRGTSILGGYDLSEAYPDLGRHMLVAVTEMNSRAEIDLFVDALAAFERQTGREA
ncbi:MAG: hypothetical protein J7M16_08440, partial [Anaerolineae bacterium]|nr:hypothetical protein [Anaerolineae bacterium]